jgi:hypothetical protein
LKKRWQRVGFGWGELLMSFCFIFFLTGSGDEFGALGLEV